MASYYFGQTDVIGRNFRIDQSDIPQELTIIVVVRNTNYKNIREDAQRIVYLPYLQFPKPVGEANYRGTHGSKSSRRGRTLAEESTGREPPDSISWRDDSGATRQSNDRSGSDACSIIRILRIRRRGIGLPWALRDHEP